jgi:hypothetical protein
MQPTYDSVGVPLPALQGGWVRVVTSENDMFDLPAASLNAAKQNDPDLRVILTALLNDVYQR